VRVNALVEQTGRITQAHVGMLLHEAVPDANPILVGAIRRVFEAGESFLNLQVSGGGDGDRTYLITLFPIGAREGEADWVGSIYSDVTDRVAAEHALAESERRRREILGTLLQAQEDERSRIATELHDDTVQVMTAAMMAMDRLRAITRKGDLGRVESAVTHVRAILEEATDRTRRLMFELRPAILHERGLSAALGVLAEQTARETGAVAEVFGPARRYDPVVEELVYRTAQEALANVRKHAAPTVITVRLADDETAVHAEVCDDGRGFDAEAVRLRDDAALHLGLESMTERVRAAGGDVRIRSAPSAGTTIAFSVPLTLAGRRPEDARWFRVRPPGG
jgi:signal transduction histidine kinase